jgi:hypothetical protein
MYSIFIEEMQNVNIKLKPGNYFKSPLGIVYSEALTNRYEIYLYLVDGTIKFEGTSYENNKSSGVKGKNIISFKKSGLDTLSSPLASTFKF